MASDDTGNIDVYLPLCVTLSPTGKLVSVVVDWEGTPWMEADNVWEPKPDDVDGEYDWTKDTYLEGLAEMALTAHFPGQIWRATDGRI